MVGGGCVLFSEIRAAGRFDSDMEIKRVSPDETKQLLDSEEGYVYIDVRTVAEFEAGHVPGAKNIPVLDRDSYGRMASNERFVEIVEKNFGKTVKCIVGCQKGARSMQAAAQLLNAGLSNVLDMRGGYGGESDAMGRMSYPGWAPRGLPTTTESPPEDKFEHLLKQVD